MILAWIIIVLLIIVSLYLRHENKSLKAKKDVELVGTIYVYENEDNTGNPNLYLQIAPEDFNALRHDKPVLLQTKVVSHQ